MIISVNDLKAQTDTGGLSDELLKIRLDAIESVIRAYTHNNFQNRNVRFVGRSEGNKLYGTSDFFKVGDTVQISESINNDGLAVITELDDDHIKVDRTLSNDDENLVTLIKYPPDVVSCAIDLFNWKLTKGDKVGIKSETISRHSVTYEDSATFFMGYPVGILNGLMLYHKARF